MIDNSKKYSFTLPDGRTGVWTEEQMQKGRDALYKKYPDAQVVSLTEHNAAQGIDDDAMYVVDTGDGRTSTWDSSQMRQGYDALLSKYPQAKVMRAKNDTYWQDKAAEQTDALNKFDADNKEFFRQHEKDTALYNTGEASRIDFDEEGYLERDRQYKDLQAKRQQMEIERANNPYIKAMYEAQSRKSDEDIARYDKQIAAIKSSDNKDKGDLRNLRQARKLARDTKDVYDVDVADSNDGFADYVRNMGQGAGDVFSDADFWTRGLTSIARNINIHGIEKRLNKDGRSLYDLTEEEIDKELTPSEKDLFLEFIRNASAQAERAGNMARGYTAGQTAAESIGYMTEFIATAGVAKGIGSALSAAESGLGKWIARELTGKTAQAITNTAGKAAYNVVARPAEKAIFHTALHPTTYSSIAEALTQIDDNGQLVDAGNAIASTVLDQIIENWSESIGEPLEKILPTSLLAKGVTSKSGQRVLSKIGKADWAKMWVDSDVHKVLMDAGFNGLVGEMAEEWAGNAVRLSVGLMDKDDFAKFASWDEQVDMMASFAPMTLFGLGSQSVAVHRIAKERNANLALVRDALTRQGWTEQEISNVLDNAHTKDEIKEILRPVVNNIVSQRTNGGDVTTDYMAMLDFARINEMDEILDEARKYERDQSRAAMRQTIEMELGATEANPDSGKFTHMMPSVNDDGTTSEQEMVTTVTDEDGNLWYLIGRDNAKVMLRKKGDTSGQPFFVTDEEYAERLTDGSYKEYTTTVDEYLDSEVEAQRKAQETRRINDAVTAQYDALNKRLMQEPTINLGTDESPKTGIIQAVRRDGVIVSFETPTDLGAGAKLIHKISLDEAMNAIGESSVADTRTDDQIARDEADREYVQEQRLKQINRKYNNASVTVNGNLLTIERVAEMPYNTEDGTEVVKVAARNASGEINDIVVPIADIQVNDELNEEDNTDVTVDTNLDFRGNPLPMKTADDGTTLVVDDRELWRRDPEAYLRWNDAQRNGVTTNSMKFLSANIDSLQRQRAEIEKKQAANLDPPSWQAYEDEKVAMDNKINTLTALYNRYLQEQQYSETVTQINQQMGQLTQRLLDTKTPEQTAEINAKIDDLRRQYYEVSTQSAQGQALANRKVQIMEWTKDYADMPVKPVDMGNVIDIITADNATPAQIAQLQDMVNYIFSERLKGKNYVINGLHLNGVCYLFAEGCINEETTKRTYFHERQHEINERTPDNIQQVIESFGGNRDMMEVAVGLLSDTDVYAGKSASELADEILSFSLEKQYIGKDMAGELHSLGFPAEYINFVTTLYGEQTKDGYRLPKRQDNGAPSVGNYSVTGRELDGATEKTAAGDGRYGAAENGSEADRERIRGEVESLFADTLGPVFDVDGEVVAIHNDVETPEESSDVSPAPDNETEQLESMLSFSIVRDQAEIDRLNNEPYKPAYHAMQLITMPDGKKYLFPPMAAIQGDSYVEGIPVNDDLTFTPLWIKADERQDLAFMYTKGKKGNKVPANAKLEEKDGVLYYKGQEISGELNENGIWEPNWYFTLKKGNKGDKGKALGDLGKVAFDPYQHSGENAVNDQFTTAYDRSHLVIVEVHIPLSEYTGESQYKADKAKLGVGLHEWKGGKLDTKKPRMVALSRWDMPVRILPDAEVAANWKKVLDENGLTEVPFNIVTPGQREELVKLGVTIGEPTNDNGGKASREVYEQWKEESKKSNPQIRRPMFRTTEVAGNPSLIAVHNLGENDLLDAFDLGGFPMPSIAITKTDIGHTDFGDISLVFGKDTINPKNRKNKVYSGDAWTPTFPTINYKLNEDKASDIATRARKVGDLPLFNPSQFNSVNYEGRIEDSDARSLIEEFKNDYNAKQFYLAEQGNPVREFEMHEVEKYTEENVRRIKELLDKIGLENLKGVDRNLSPEILQVVKGFLNAVGDIDDSHIKRIARNYVVRAIDYATNGNRTTEIDYDATHRKIDERIDQSAFEKWLEDLFSGIVEKRGIRNEVDMFTPIGNRRAWEKLYDEVTLDNVVKAMSKKPERGGSGFFGGNIFGASFKTYNSIADIQEDAARRMAVVDSKELQKQKDDILNRLSNVKVTEKELGVGEMFDLTTNIRDAVAKSHTADGIYRYLKDYYPDITMDAAQEIADIVKDIQSISTKYFEAKPYRAVGFDEVKLAVVPEDASQAIVDGLQERGVPVRTYEKDNQQERMDIISNATEEMGLRFRTMEITPETRGEMEKINAIARLNGTYLKAPNGADTNLNPEQWAMVRTKKFKDWFGYWENDPENASKVVDENGEPRVVRHMSEQEFTTFKERDSGMYGISSLGFFTDDYSQTEWYKENVWNSAVDYYSFLNLRNPLVVDFEGSLYYEPNANVSQYGGDTDNIVARTRAGLNGEGYDGVIMLNVGEEFGGTFELPINDYVPFFPNQIKSATVNTGSFNPTDPDIRYRVTPAQDAEDMSAVEAGDMEKAEMIFRDVRENNDVRFRVVNNNQQVFISNALASLDKIPMKSGNAQAWINKIQQAGGLKKEEDKWIGLTDWLKEQAGNISKEDVSEYIREHQVQIEEVHYAGDAEDDAENTYAMVERILQEKFSNYIAEYYEQNNGENDDLYGGDPYEYALDKLRKEMNDESPYAIERSHSDVYLTFPYEETDDLQKWADKLGINFAPQNPINSTRLDYTTDGLIDKREIALVVPTIASYNESDEIHFGDAGEGRAIAWARFGEAVDEDGNRILVIDEIQSKRHQEGKENGYKDRDILSERDASIAEENAAQNYNRILFELLRKYSVREVADGLMSEEDNAYYKDALEKKREAQRIYNLATSGVPDAPFRDSWDALAMKRMLRLAAEEGYDKIAWTSGQMQSDRYSLTKRLENFYYKPNADGTYKVSATLNQRRHGYTDYSELNYDTLTIDKISEIFGKEIASKVSDGKGRKGYSHNNEGEWTTFSGRDLKIINDGMRYFYDQKLVNWMNKYGKKWGVQVIDMTLPDLENREGWHSIAVTPEMKESVMQGQMMFSVGSIAQQPEKENESLINEPVNDTGEEYTVSASTPISYRDIQQRLINDGLAEVGEEEVSDLMMDVFSNSDESVRNDIIKIAPRFDYSLSKATGEYFSTLALKDALSGSEMAAINKMRDVMRDAIGTDNLSAADALWIMYRTMGNPTANDIFAIARDTEVASRLGHSAQGIQARRQAEDAVRMSVTEAMHSQSAAEMYNQSVAYWRNRLKEGYVDMYESVNDLMSSMEKATGHKAEEYEDIRIALNQQSSKALDRMKRYTADYLEPLWEAIGKAIQTSRYDMDGVIRYVELKHALERNDKFAKRDAIAFYQEEHDKLVKPLKDELNELKREMKKAVENGDADEELRIGERIDIIDEQITDHDNSLSRHIRRVENGTSAKYRELRENDYAGLTGLYSEYPGLLPRNKYKTDEEYNKAARKVRRPKYDTLQEMENEAQHEIDVFEAAAQKEQVDNLWDRINAATKETLRSQYASGIISRAQYNSVKDMFDYYVPLRGFKDDVAEDIWSYYTSAPSGSFSAPVITAKGRQSEAENPFLWIGTMASSAIAQNMKNESKLALYYYAMNNPQQDLVKVQDMWYELDVAETASSGRKVFVASYPPLTAGMTPEDAVNVYNAWEESMRQKASVGQAYTRHGNFSTNGEVAFIDNKKKAEHFIRVKANGRAMIMYVNGSPRAAQAINGLLNVENTTDYKKVFGGLLRLMSSLNTSWNPEFWISNMQRDLLFATMSMDIKGDGAKDFRQNLVTPARMMRLSKAYADGTLNELKGKDAKYAQYFKEFAEGGAITGYTVVKSNEVWEKEIDSWMKSNGVNYDNKGKDPLRGVKSVVKSFFGKFSDLGEAVEQMTRFSAFVTARKAGKSIADSVNDAKEISVNFNRKGSGKAIEWKELDQLIKADGTRLNNAEKAVVYAASLIPAYGRRTIMFFNAAIQGLNAMYKLWEADKRKTAKWMAGYFTMGVLQAVIHSMLDDDDEYLNIPEYTRRANAMIGAGGIYFKWALPQESRFFYAAGDILVQRALGNEKERGVLPNIAQGAFEIINQALDLSPINPAGGVTDILPSLAQPLVENYINKDFTGANVYYENKYLSEDEIERTPKFSNTKRGTSGWAINAAKLLNYISGGDSEDAGWWNWHPESIQNFVEGLGGGTLTTIGKLGDTVNGLAGTGDLTVRRTLFINRILELESERSMQYHTNELYRFYKGEAEHTKTKLKKYKKMGALDDQADLMGSDDYEIYLIFERYRKLLEPYEEQLKIEESSEEKRILNREMDALKREMIHEISNL